MPGSGGSAVRQRTRGRAERGAPAQRHDLAIVVTHHNLAQGDPQLERFGAIARGLTQRGDAGQGGNFTGPCVLDHLVISEVQAKGDHGTLDEFGIEMIGANRKIIHRAEDRQIFKDICENIGLKLPRAKTVNTLDDALEFLKEIGLPAIIRPEHQSLWLGETEAPLDEVKAILQRLVPQVHGVCAYRSDASAATGSIWAALRAGR